MQRIAIILGGLGLASIGCRTERADEFTQLALPSPATSPQSADPALALDPDGGDVLLTWVGGDSAGWTLYFARSRDQGASWSAPVVVAGGEGEIHPQGESSPRLVAATDGRLAVTWVKRVPVPGRRYPATQIRVVRSVNGGASWSLPVTLNDDTTKSPAGHQFHGAAWRGDSGLVVSWLDERQGAALELHQGHPSPTADDVTDEPDAVIYAAASGDFGRTWSRANQPLWSEVCPCCRVTLAREPDGGVISAWRKHYPGNIRDVVVAPVLEGAAPEPDRVHQDNWVYPGCPYTGPGIAVGDDGARHVVWYMGKEGDAGVYYQRLLRDENALGDPLPLLRARTLPSAHTTVAAAAGGRAVAAYDMTETGDRAISVAVIGSGALLQRLTLDGSTGGQYPQVVATGPGQALVAWIARNGERREIRLNAIKFRSQGSDAAVALNE